MSIGYGCGGEGSISRAYGWEEWTKGMFSRDTGTGFRDRCALSGVQAELVLFLISPRSPQGGHNHAGIFRFAKAPVVPTQGAI